MKEKFTSGEWAVRYNSAGAIEVAPGGGNGWVGDDYLCIGVITLNKKHRDKDCHNNPLALANAHLISAAPDMYFFIKDTIDKLPIEERHAACALLAKARGEE